MRHEGTLCCQQWGWLQGAEGLPGWGESPSGDPTPRGLSGHHWEARRKRAGETFLQVGQDWAGALGERGVEISRWCWQRRSNSEL